MTTARNYTPEGMLRPDDAAALLCVSRRTFYRLVKAGRLAPALKLNRKCVYYARHDVEQLSREDRP